MDNKGLIICGPMMSGKSFLVHELVDKNHTEWLNGRNSPNMFKYQFLFRDVTEDTKYIVIDDLTINKDVEEHIIGLMSDEIRVVRKFQPEKTIKNDKKIIITTDTSFQEIMDLSKDFHEKWNVVEINQCGMVYLKNKEVQNARD